ncbi:unnamed protein product, partial [Rotaria socialis]
EPEKPKVHQHTSAPLTILHTPPLKHVRLQDAAPGAVELPIFDSKIKSSYSFC